MCFIQRVKLKTHLCNKTLLPAPRIPIPNADPHCVQTERLHCGHWQDENGAKVIPSQTDGGSRINAGASLRTPENENVQRKSRMRRQSKFLGSVGSSISKHNAGGVLLQFSHLSNTGQGDSFIKK